MILSLQVKLHRISVIIESPSTSMATFQFVSVTCQIVAFTCGTTSECDSSCYLRACACWITSKGQAPIQTWVRFHRSRSGMVRHFKMSAPHLNRNVNLHRLQLCLRSINNPWTLCANERITSQLVILHKPALIVFTVHSPIHNHTTDITTWLETHFKLPQRKQLQCHNAIMTYY